ncbi:hypothetical protein SRHO_G00060120 [Serrasalmus rhombeus]
MERYSRAWKCQSGWGKRRCLGLGYFQAVSRGSEQAGVNDISSRQSEALKCAFQITSRHHKEENQGQGRHLRTAAHLPERKRGVQLALRAVLLAPKP